MARHDGGVRHLCVPLSKSLPAGMPHQSYNHAVCYCTRRFGLKVDRLEQEAVLLHIILDAEITSTNMSKRM